ncbi:MAG: hypothetical protein GY841_16380 [FCB group bacterium]|nr:hypothetical protein [FCB group bacterium]
MRTIKTLVIMAMALALCAPAWAGNGFGHPGDYKIEKDDGGTCPVTKVSGAYHECMNCHQMQMVDGEHHFGLKRVKPYLKYAEDLPTYVQIRERGDELILWFEINTVDDDKIEAIIEFVKKYPEFKTVRLDVFNPGGAMMAALRIVGMMEDSRSFISWETHVSAFAASAGFMIFMAGDSPVDGPNYQGKRSVTAKSLLMWHEVSSFAWLKVETPSGLRDDAEIMTLFQDNVHVWLAKRSNVSVHEIHKMVERKEMWARGVDCIEKYGFGDYLSSPAVEAPWEETKKKN